jgi:hypothetical protein
MSRLRTILALDQPQETRFFLVLGAFGIVIGVVYGFLSYEVAGTALLIGFGLATGIVGVVLALDPRAARVRAAVRDRATAGIRDLDEPDTTGAGTGGIDRPFLDETGRLPSETLAPFAVGLGLSTALTAVVFGLAMLVLGAIPLAWGTWTWLRRAGAEFSAQEAADLSPAPAPPAFAARRTGGRTRRAAGEASPGRSRARSRSG